LLAGGRVSSLSFDPNTFDCSGGEITLAGDGEQDSETGCNHHLNKFEKALIPRQTLGQLSTPDLTQALEETFF